MVLTLSKSYALDRTIAQRAPEQVVLDTYNQFSAGHYLDMYKDDKYTDLRREIMNSTKQADTFQDAYGEPPKTLERFATTYNRLAARYNRALENRDEERMKRIAELSEKFKTRTLERLQLDEAA